MKFSRPQVSIEKLEEFFSNVDLQSISPKNTAKVLRQASGVLWCLNFGKLRVASPSKDGNWDVHVWVKRAILAHFKLSRMGPLSSGCFEYLDKLPVKARGSLKGVRVLPGAIARYGSFAEPGVVLMPSFLNIGAYVGQGSMVDTWATVGSCAQVGAGVHLAGGVGIGGVLEPEQAQPVIIEDGAFIGSRAIVVEGVRVGKQAVLGAGVVLTASTKVIDVRNKEPKISSGFIPERAVVIPGNYPKEYPAGTYGVPCALVIGTRNASTDLKVSLNQALREYSVSI